METVNGGKTMVRNWQEEIIAAQQGDLTAFERVVRQFEDMAVGYAYSILGDFHLAEDAAQEAFIQAYRDLPSLREPLAFPAWLRRIVFKQCDRFKRRHSLAVVPLDETRETLETGDITLETVQRREIHNRVLSAVNELPENERTVTALFYINGYSMAEVGEFLEAPVSTIKNRLHTARKLLRQRMVDMVEETLKMNAPGEDFSRRVTKVLTGIERIHWETTSCLCFAGAVTAAMHFLGETVTNHEVMGISGGAFKLFWYPGWSPANCDLLIYGEEPIRRTFAALGYDYTYYFRPDQTDDIKNAGEFYRQKIVAEINAGRPVIAIGVVGPPECCVISGYDKEGRVLHGWSYFQENQDGYFRAEDWEDNCQGLILIGAKKSPPSPREVLKMSLEFAIKLARVPTFEGRPVGPEWRGIHLSGFAAYDEIINALLRDADYPAGDLEILTFRAVALCNDGIALLALKRCAAAEYLEQAVKQQLPGSESLAQAAAYYRGEYDLLQPLLGKLPYSFSPAPELQKLADRTFREEMAVKMREAKAVEEKAVAYLEEGVRELVG